MFGRKKNDDESEKSGFDRLSEESEKEGGLGSWNEIAKGCAGIEGAKFNFHEAEKASDRGDERELNESKRWTDASLNAAEKSLNRAKDIVEGEIEKRDNETGERKRGWFG